MSVKLESIVRTMT